MHSLIFSHGVFVPALRCQNGHGYKNRTFFDQVLFIFGENAIDKGRTFKAQRGTLLRFSDTDGLITITQFRQRFLPAEKRLDDLPARDAQRTDVTKPAFRERSAF